MSLDPTALPAPHIAPAATLPLVEELVPAPDPWDVAHKLAHLPHLLFLDSADNQGLRGQYSYVTADPVSWLTGQVYNFAYDHPFEALPFPLRQFPMDSSPDLPPFQGGLAGLFGYDLCHWIERLPWARRDEFSVPDVALGVYDWVVAFDHDRQRAWLVSAGFPHRHPGRCRDRAAERLRQVRSWLVQETDPRPLPPSTRPPVLLSTQYPLPGFPGVTSNFDRLGFEATVRRAVEYIHAGDCFQVNLAQRLLAPAPADPLGFYGRLRAVNPAPFAGYFDLGDFAIASASPERFLKVTSNGQVETRPIKGTRPRGRTPAEDDALRRELLASPKDRAENVMIVDLLRNDLGRVCEYGSVRVAKVCELESYRTVHHLVSEVRGKLRPGAGPVDLLRAAFPGGSVTGAPKVRAMEIIAELEPTARGPYCGSLGYIGFDGSMDTNILIRTFTIGRGWAQFPVGGGIVADSDPAREYEETLHKAAGLLRALE
jgi:para-aminobenzoate synthetase component 1